MNIIGIIPARMASVRFPGKPLVKIHGLPMLGHVYFRSRMSKLLKGLYVATCDKEIADYVKSIGGIPIMTRTTHRCAPDRTAEAMKKIEKLTGQKIDVVLMIQGDEPMIRSIMLDDTVKPILEERTLQVSNLGLAIENQKQRKDPNIVKVVVDKQNFALYFSREPIPSFKMGVESGPMLKQTGIIAFGRDFLIKFNRLKPTPLELIEKIDMLRLLENGFKVKMTFSDYPLYSVDTPQDRLFVEKIMKNDDLMKFYL